MYLIAFQRSYYSIFQTHLDLFVFLEWHWNGRTWCDIGIVLKWYHQLFIINNRRRNSFAKSELWFLWFFRWLWVGTYLYFENIASEKQTTELCTTGFPISVEHTLSVSSLIHFVVMCESNKDPMTELVRVQGPHLFTQTNHTSIWKVVCVKFLNLTSTFVWNFLDVFIMTISIALSTQFELFNRELIRTKNEVIYYKKKYSIFMCKLFLSLSDSIYLNHFGYIGDYNIEDYVIWLTQ